MQLHADDKLAAGLPKRNLRERNCSIFEGIARCAFVKFVVICVPTDRLRLNPRFPSLWPAHQSPRRGFLCG